MGFQFSDLKENYLKHMIEMKTISNKIPIITDSNDVQHNLIKDIYCGELLEKMLKLKQSERINSEDSYQ